MAADNEITAVRVNGVVVPGLTFVSNGAFSSLVSITPGSFGGPNPFVIGTNTLEFTILDTGTFGGFRVEIDGDGTQFGQVPEPGSLVMLGGGLVVLGIGARRRLAR
jgi:hypothetical protein